MTFDFKETAGWKLMQQEERLKQILEKQEKDKKQKTAGGDPR